MVELQPSKLITRVRFPSPAPEMPRPRHCDGAVFFSGAPSRNRTYNLRIRSPLLYPLSHGRASSSRLDGFAIIAHRRAVRDGSLSCGRAEQRCGECKRSAQSQKATWEPRKKSLGRSGSPRNERYGNGSGISGAKDPKEPERGGTIAPPSQKSQRHRRLRRHRTQRSPSCSGGRGRPH